MVVIQECDVCHKLERTACTGCLNAVYCSKACQKRDWPIHKILCKSFKNFADSTRPSKTHIRALLFPDHSATPEFIWLPTSTVEFPDVNQYLDHPASVAGFPYARGGVEDARCVSFYHESDFADVRTGHNQVMKVAIPFLRKNTMPFWVGNVVVVASQSVCLPPEEMHGFEELDARRDINADLDMGDLKAVFEYIRLTAK